MKTRRPATSTSSSSAGQQVCSPQRHAQQTMLGNAEMQRRLEGGPAIRAAPSSRAPKAAAPERPGEQWLNTGDLDFTINGLVGAEMLQDLSKGAEIVDTGEDFVSKMPGGTKLGTGLSVVGAVNTALNHQASNTGTAGDIERVMVGAADLAAGAALGGPLGFLDAATGSHGSGLIKGGAEGVVSLATGDVDAMGRTAEGLKEGKHGKLAQGVAHVGDGLGTGAAWAANKLMGGKAPPDLGRAANSDWERQKEAELRQDPRYRRGSITWK